ncbi:rRNA maturation RNase YbeY [Limisalsivibrio acetivorans]|uniref:rRNA maturation RNase YbeY n=1 Tax=Limisalsivibrio acetivorans TaxID=1304888 RepID=UPI0003B46D26|nr:rRNA maturation RNase YbeY [Limisalsivibrio acetivorans]
MMVDVLITDKTESGLDRELFTQLTKDTFRWIEADFMEAEVSILVTDDEEIAGLNSQYRNREGATDVLSFPLSDSARKYGGMLGDVVISADTARKQAESSGIDFVREIAFLYIHGLLHLLNYDHERGEEDEKEMFSIQEAILKDAVARGYVP